MAAQPAASIRRAHPIRQPADRVVLVELARIGLLDVKTWIVRVTSTTKTLPSPTTQLTRPRLSWSASGSRARADIPHPLAFAFSALNSIGGRFDLKLNPHVHAVFLDGYRDKGDELDCRAVGHLSTRGCWGAHATRW